MKPQLTDERNTFKPFKYPWAYDAWLQHEQSHWLHSEVPMGEDLKDYQKKLKKEEKEFLTNNPTLPLCRVTWTLEMGTTHTTSPCSSNQRCG
jgi:ribonucleotide reductase beta subunit family protein with ferritin-like domain